MRLRMAWAIFGILIVTLVTGCGGPVFTNSSDALKITGILPSGTVNVSYSSKLSVSGGLPPYTWSVSNGTLPAGLTLSSVGILSGMPTAAGSSTVTIIVADSAHASGTLTVTLVVADGTISITTPSPLASGALGVAYSATLAATGGTAPYTWSLASGSLPGGVTLSSAGVIAGTPTTYGPSTFTVKATDSAPTPASATASFSLQVSGGPLAITTTALPQGTQGTPYSAQLAATGGTPPYKWTMNSPSPIPAGLSFSSAGLLAGTPTGVGNVTPIFTVVDSVGGTASASLNLIVQPASAPTPDGHYSFVFGGTSPQGTPTVINAIAINGTFTVRSGAVISGFFDANTNSGTALLEQPITGGSLTTYSNGLGTLVLQSEGGSFTFSLAIPPSSSQGADTAIRIIAYDDADGSGMRGSGVLKPAKPNPATSAIGGNFAFLISGSDQNQQEQALTGSFQTDSNGNILTGVTDANQAGGTYTFPVGGGTYSVDANGRGTFGLVLCYPCGPPGNTPYHYSFYEVSPGEWLTISTDPPSENAPLVSGSVLQQTGSFSNASLTGSSVLELSGLAPQANSEVPDITLGLATADGNGNLALSYDEYKGAFLPGQTAKYTYTVDPTTGRVVTTSAAGAGGPAFYMIDSSHAFVVDADASASSGMLELQSGSPFSNASFSGSYLGGSLSLVNTSVLNQVGIVAADGAGNVLFTTDSSTPTGLVQYENVAGTYAVDSTGRVVVTTPGGDTRIFYIVSPAKVAYLTSDGGGYLGSFAQ
jgi:hypothetical protein